MAENPPTSPPTINAPTVAPGIAHGTEPSHPDLVTLKIDGRTVQARKGTNVLEAARTIGTSISYFCYHPGLSSPAVCRQCLVEVKGQPKLVPSCYTPVAENMDVLTESEKVVTARAQMLEFTLVNHPVDCPICDKAGECTLQKMYQEWDGSPSRVDTGKVHKPKVVDLGPEIVLDAERCILCTRCIRVCDEVAGQHQLEMAWRGDREQLTTAPGKRLDNPYALNTVDVCPVGALTSKDFRFAMRAWELYTTPSVCAGCATGCNDEVHHAQGRIYRLVPRENQQVNKFWMCDEGRFTYKEIATKRLGVATIARDVAPLDKAISFAAERIAGLRDAGAGKLIGVVLNAQATNEDNYLLAKVANALGVEKVYLAGRPSKPDRADNILRSADVNPNTAGARILGGGKAKGTQQLNADLVSGALKGLWILGDHVALDEDALQALGKLDIVVYQSPHENFLTEHASVVLPAAAWAEVDGTFTNGKGIVQRIRKAVDTPGDALPHLELIARLAKKLGVELGRVTPKAVFGELKASVSEFAEASFGREAPRIQLRFAGSRG
jgi:NADH-quinone oxidoreductase subunit G